MQIHVMTLQREWIRATRSELDFVNDFLTVSSW